MLGCWVNPAEMCLLWNDFELGRSSSRRRLLCYRCRCRRPGERARNRISQAGIKRVKKRRRKRVEGGLLLLLLLRRRLLLGKKQREKGTESNHWQEACAVPGREQSGAEPQQPESCSHFLSSDGVGPRDSRIYCRKDRKRVVVDAAVDCQGGWEEY